ncbi:MAG: Gfo/Idh/MocA family oxidoreductase [Verrucomicrobia bacterium]|nr:Gfo/Idh/MocA family oxidoreductase [Verrucomicrobiota bacterium]
MTNSEYNRRDFLKGTSSFAAMMAIMGAVPIRAADDAKDDIAAKTAEDPLNFGVIGCGVWGREIIKTLSARPNAPVVGVCDTYKPFLNRIKDAAPKAEQYTEYQKLLENKNVQGVVIATPSHLHKDIVIAALKAGKHVYCEAPMATTLEDARAMAQAAKASPKLNFQVGLLPRADKQMTYLLNFVRTGVLGKFVKVRAQSHKKQSWRRASPNPEREKEINWRLDKNLSLGLLGEIGIHQMDMACWYLMGRPLAVSGYGGLVQWTDDGREVPDTVQAVFEFPNNVVFNQEITLANSFDSDYDIFYGSDSAIMIRDRKAWMFKESDSQLLGWEVYARKETFYKESGIVLGADATKLTPSKPAEPKPGETASTTPAPVVEETALSLSLRAFLTNTLGTINGVQEFIDSFGDKDQKALVEYLAGLAKMRQPAASWKDGYESAVIAMKANEAVTKKQRIVFSKEWFEIA